MGVILCGIGGKSSSDVKESFIHILQRSGQRESSAFLHSAFWGWTNAPEMAQK